MAPRGFDRYMVQIGMGTHPKFARLTDGEFRAHVVGILAVAAGAPVRGYLLVGDLPAEAIDIATVAGVPEKVAASALDKLTAVGVLRRDEDRNCLRVHDWDDINPSPGADRTKRWRDGKRDADVTPTRHTNVTRTSQTRHPEVEVEVEEEKNNTNTALRALVLEIFNYWQERCNHPTAKLTPKREKNIKSRLRDGYTVHEIRKAIDGAARGAYVNEGGHRFDDIELICRSGEKLESFMARADATPPPTREWAIGNTGTVVPFRKTNADEIITKLDLAHEEGGSA